MRTKIFAGKDLADVELQSTNFFAFIKDLKIKEIAYSFPGVQMVIMTIFYDGYE